MRRALIALSEVDYPAFNIVVVDDGSSPEHSIENQRACTTTGAQYIAQPNAGPAAARNRGVATTQSGLVAFLDDDCAPTPGWLRSLVAPFLEDQDGRLGGVGGAVRSEPPHNWVGHFCAAGQYSTGIPSEFTNAATANACFRRKVLEEVRGFDEGFRHPGGDDPDLSRRVRELGHSLMFVPDAIVYHVEIDSVTDLVRHIYRRGLGEARGKRKEGRTSWVAMRAVLFPIFCARRAGQTWRSSRGMASVVRRLAYAITEGVVSLAFIAGSVVGLLQRR